MKKALVEEGRGAPVAGLMITKVVREHIPLHRPRDGYGETFGQAIDAAIAACLEAGDEVRSFEVEIHENHWRDLQSAFDASR